MAGMLIGGGFLSAAQVPGRAARAQRKTRPGGKGTAALPDPDGEAVAGRAWWVAGMTAGRPEEAEVELDEAARLYAGHGLWESASG